MKGKGQPLPYWEISQHPTQDALTYLRSSKSTKDRAFKAFSKALGGGKIPILGDE